MCLPVKMTGPKSAAGVLVVEPREEFVHAYGFPVAHFITDAVANHTMVQVMNPRFAPVTVHENVRVGMLHSIVDCAKIQPARKQSRPKQAIKDTIGQMTSSLAPGVQDRVLAHCTTQTASREH